MNNGAENESDFYGELVVMGTNGKLPGGNKGKKCNKIRLCKRDKPNGIRPARISDTKDISTMQAVTSDSHHTVSYTVSRQRAIVVEYETDEEYDMFQIGRSNDSHIDMVVIDIDLLKRGHYGEEGLDAEISESTVSRYACRILVRRNPPHVARVYAAGFDSRKNIFLGEKAIRWRNGDQPDGFTTNGVMIHHPQSQYWPSSETDPPDLDRCDSFQAATQTAEEIANSERNELLKQASIMGWREVSVCGSLFNMQSHRCVPNSSLRVKESNILRDGTLIDLCGITLLWRAAKGLTLTATPLELQKMVDELNDTHIQCPINYRTLVLPRLHSGNRHSIHQPTAEDRRPMVYIKCGHVHGPHEWKGPSDRGDGLRTCPICMQVGGFVPIHMGKEPAFYVDREPATHCFDPCGHLASEKTVRYWVEMRLPNRTNHELQPKCPFCATTVTGCVKLIFP